MRNLPLTLLLAAAVLTGCDDQLGPQPWDDTPISARLWSIDRADYVGLPSAYDVAGLRTVVVEQPGQATSWDIALTGSEAGLAFTPAGAYPDIASRAGIAVITDRAFEELTRAPGEDGAYATSEAVPVTDGGVYVIRSRQAPCGFGSVAQLYAKLRVLEVDAPAGTARFEVVRNPNCNDRSLVPPDDDD